MNDILKKRLSVDVPARCWFEECVKGRAFAYNDKSRGCIYCSHVTLNISCKKCVECLSTENLCNFEIDKWYELSAEKWHKQNVKG